MAKKESPRHAHAHYRIGVLKVVDRAALAAYSQEYGRWLEAEERPRETPALFKTPGGYVQQSPWLGIANEQLELLGRFMVELGMTPASRSRLSVTPDAAPQVASPAAITVEFLSARQRQPKELDLQACWQEPEG